MRRILSMLLFAAGVLSADEPVNGTYIATAYAQHDLTASGLHVHRHIVAADPDVLPIGSRIKIRHAGRYSGEYVVADTGDKIQGRKLDIYMPNANVCKKFGIKPVRVRVLKLGDGTHSTAKQSDAEVKQDVEKDVEKKVVGNAATEDDWVAKGKPPATPATPSPTTPAATASKSTNTPPPATGGTPQ